MKHNSPTLHFLFYSLFIVTCFINTASAQPKTGRFIDVSLGYGLSFPYDDVDIEGGGFYAQGEYVFGISKWLGIRPYAGVILTSDTETDDALGIPEYEVTAKAFVLGGKVRVAAPIPWVAPYLEGGIGLSLGTLRTFTPVTDITKNGMTFHIPFTVGLSLGRNNRFALEYTYYYHPTADQIAGAAAIGISIPVK